MVCWRKAKLFNLADSNNLIVPTLVQFELYKWCLLEKDEAAALDVIGRTETSPVRSLDTRIALTSADLSTRHKLCHLPWFMPQLSPWEENY